MTVRFPDWTIYAASVGALLLVAAAERERADAPEAPPPLQASEDLLLGSPVRFERTIPLDPAPPGARSATAFSLSASGRWVTAAQAMDGCHKPVVLTGGARALEARFAGRAGEAVRLATDGAAVALPLAPVAALRPGERGFAVGFPEGRPGEAATRLIGPVELPPEGRGGAPRLALAWALLGRTRGLNGTLDGLQGGPMLDAEGRAVGVVLGEARRRGLLYTTTPQALATLAAAPAKEPAPGQPITADNYGRAADSLRRDLRVAEVRCL